ncbi:hypothetical protein [Streptomonospora litoralis]|uniref:Uncharacterized protein n=1 Tax=Streptomonospora litoralis TaxID=2498135 RepID=A0A4P6QB18_9ACTN|nr:hypothetical protein [Streptomonospora litoralis]QBI56547.1 hypothetical protein EKD16_24010 [Streptomonospora litoralis]
MTHLNAGEHAARVMQREAERRGIALEPETDAARPGDMPAELLPWSCRVAGKGWCVFAALDPVGEITTPAERDFLPLPQVLANSWQILGGTGSVRVSTAPR